MAKPSCLTHKLSYEFDTNVIQNLNPMAIPVTDDMCVSLNKRLYRANTIGRKNAMIQSHQSAGGKKFTLLRYVTLISNKHVIQGCRGEAPAPDSPAPPAPQPAAPVVNVHAEEALTIFAVREKCNALRVSLDPEQ